jgi:hypothetical protein
MDFVEGLPNSQDKSVILWWLIGCQTMLISGHLNTHIQLS